MTALNADRIVTLNLGLGRDSMTMLLLLCERALLVDGALRGPEEVDAVVFADTGAEWPHTYSLLPLVEALCAERGLRFLWLKKPPEHGETGWRRWLREDHPLRVDRPWRASEEAVLEALLREAEIELWREAEAAALARKPARPVKVRKPGRGRIEARHLDMQRARLDIKHRAETGFYHGRAPIMEDYKSRATVASIGKGDCTDNQKIGPIRACIADLALERFGVSNNGSWGAAVSKGTRPQHLTLIGIAADEAHRAAEGRSRVSFVTEAYPLVEMGIAKGDEAEILARWDLEEVRKSGCFMCPYQPPAWFWALQTTLPDKFAQVERYEAEALAANFRMSICGRMVGPRGQRRSVPIREMVARWRAQNQGAGVKEVLNKTYERGGKGA